MSLRFILLSFVFLSFSTQNLEAVKNKNPNKEVTPLLKKNFSNSNQIDFDGIHKHIAYTFKDPKLLEQALNPLLPVKLQHEDNKFDRLESLGDKVLGHSTMRRLFKKFPTTVRGFIVNLCGKLVQNVTLTSLYHKKLTPIEKFLPFPGEGRTAEYCNVVEALIGAIDQDDPENGTKNADLFLRKLMDDPYIDEKAKEIAVNSNNQPKKSPTEKGNTNPVLPFQSAGDGGNKGKSKAPLKQRTIVMKPKPMAAQSTSVSLQTAQTISDALSDQNPQVASSANTSRHLLQGENSTPQPQVSNDFQFDYIDINASAPQKKAGATPSENETNSPVKKVIPKSKLKNIKILTQKEDDPIEIASDQSPVVKRIKNQNHLKAKIAALQKKEEIIESENEEIVVVKKIAKKAKLKAKVDAPQDKKAPVIKKKVTPENSLPKGASQEAAEKNRQKQLAANKKKAEAVAAKKKAAVASAKATNSESPEKAKPVKVKAMKAKAVNPKAKL